MSDKVHIWEFNGIGKAPFKCVGMASIPSTSLAEQNPHAYNKAMQDLPKGFGVGSCEVCGTPLVNNFLIKDAEGRKFAVGCDCVRKSSDAGLIEKVDAIRREREREKRAEKRMAKMREQQAAYEAELDAQRTRNGGMTDDEVAEAARKAALEEKIALLLPLADALRDDKGGFRDSVADDLERGRLPYGRGCDLVIEILSKKAGRKNSKAYAEEAVRIKAILDAVSED